MPEAIRFFGGQGKIFKVHLRNVTAPLPEGFAETFLDDGYMDMTRVVGALHEVGFEGAIISDHLPKTAGGRAVAEAYSIGYIRGLINATAVKH
ncbi:MAG: mannonate dehydratase [Opitutaceae bacterium]